MKLSTILLVEDDPDIQTVARMSLQFRGVTRVEIAANGEECLRMVSAVVPDVILLDVMMPRMDGYETCRRLKADAATERIPVIFLTAKTQHFEVKQGLQLGAIGYLIKPFDPMTLYDQVARLLEQAAASGGAP